MCERYDVGVVKPSRGHNNYKLRSIMPRKREQRRARLIRKARSGSLSSGPENAARQILFRLDVISRRMRDIKMIHEL